MAPRPKGFEPLLPALLTLLALALRAPGLGNRSLWLDEAWRANLALAPSWSGFWDEVLGGEAPGRVGAPMPPLFALVLRMVALLAGPSELALRAVPLACGVVAVPLAYGVARRWSGRLGAVVAGWCFACYPAAILHGQELKQYTTDVLVVLGLSWCADRIAAAPERTSRWATLALCAALAPGLSYPAILVLPGLAIGSLMVCPSRRARARWAVAHGGIALAAAAWYALAIAGQRGRAQVDAYWASGFPAEEGLALASWAGLQLLAFLRYACGDPVWPFAALALGGLFVMPRWAGLASLVTLASAAAAAALRLYPLAPGRTSLFLLPVLFLALATGAARLAPKAGARGGRRVARLAAAAAALAVLAWPARGSLDVRPVAEETRPLVRQLAGERRPDDHVYVYYSAVPAFRFYHPTIDERIHLGASHRDDPAAYGRELHPLLVPGRRLWLLFSHDAPAPDGRSERDLILAEVALYGEARAGRGTEGASLHLFEITRAPGSVRRLQLSPDDLRDPGRLRELLGR